MKLINISIVVPIYKVPIKLLRNNIEHLINQSMKNIEIILVDDGSPDECGKICDEYAKKDNRIKVIHKKNMGLSAARNTGVKNASGEYVMFLDGDDWLELKSCEWLYDCVKDKKYDIVDACLVKQYGDAIYEADYSKFIDGKVYNDDEVKFWQIEMLDFNGNVSSANAKLMRRSFLLENNIFHDEQLKFGAEGIEFGIRLYGKAKSVVFIKKNIYHYVYNSLSITEVFNEENINLTLQSFKKIKKTISQCPNNNELLNKYYNRMLYVINTAAISGYFSPTNNESYKIKKQKYLNYLNSDEDIKKALNLLIFDDMPFKRKIVIYLIKFKMFKMVDLIAKIRYKQKCERNKNGVMTT